MLRCYFIYLLISLFMMASSFGQEGYYKGGTEELDWYYYHLDVFNDSTYCMKWINSNVFHPATSSGFYSGSWYCKEDTIILDAPTDTLHIIDGEDILIYRGYKLLILNKKKFMLLPKNHGTSKHAILKRRGKAKRRKDNCEKPEQTTY